MGGFKRKYGKGAAHTMTMVSGERKREGRGTPFKKTSDPLLSGPSGVQNDLVILKKKPSTSGAQQVPSSANSSNNRGGTTGVLPRIIKDGGSRLHQNLTRQNQQQRGNQSSMPHRSIMMTSVTAAHIAQQKYPPQA